MRRMFIVNEEPPYCYCRSETRVESMLHCSKCKNLFHLDCLLSGSPTKLLGDSFFELICAVCNDGEELVSRVKMSWTQVVQLSLYNLHASGAGGKSGYYRWKEHICSFIGKNWSTFFGVNKKKSSGWHGTVAGTLSSGCPQYFKSGASVTQEPGWWCLVEMKPPNRDLNPTVPSPKASRPKASTSNPKDVPVKSLRDRRNKTSIQAAMELRAKRDGMPAPEYSNKRSLSPDSGPGVKPPVPIPSTPNKRSLSPDLEPLVKSAVPVVEASSTSIVAGVAKQAKFEIETMVEEPIEEVVVKEEPLSELDSVHLFGDFLGPSASSCLMSDDDLEVDPCSISPCDSPMMSHNEPDVELLLDCIKTEDLADIEHVMTPSDVTRSDLTHSDVTASLADVSTNADTSTNASITGETSDEDEEESRKSDVEAEQPERKSTAVETASEEKSVNCRPLSVYEEEHLLKKMDHLLENVTNNHKANRLRAKLRLRKLKRERGLPVFDLDSRYRELTNQPSEYSQFTNKSDAYLAYLGLEKGNLMTSRSGLGDRVLDRFQGTSSTNRTRTNDRVTFRQRLIGSDDSQLTCIISPYTTRRLKPFIRRDYKSRPKRMQLLQEIVAYPHRNDRSWVEPTLPPIDYSYVRPQHIASINQLCAQFFWPGIDLSECLQYPDFSCVVLYRRIVIGFAFMVPDVQYNEAYISFIFVHPDWRSAGIATYMIYHLIQTCLGKDITLHVSATNPAMVLYQKFGFKPEEFVLDFYDKYYPYDCKECRHAFLLRLRR